VIDFIGNKKNLRTLLPRIQSLAGMSATIRSSSPTEASINIADDDELLQAMKDANFFAIFVASRARSKTLVQMKKKQNTRRNIAECINKIYGYGMFVTAASSSGSIPRSLDGQGDRLHRGDDIRSAWFGLLYALPGTQLTRRLAKAGRLHKAMTS